MLLVSVSAIELLMIMICIGGGGGVVVVVVVVGIGIIVVVDGFDVGDGSGVAVVVGDAFGWIGAERAVGILFWIDGKVIVVLGAWVVISVRLVAISVVVVTVA